MKLLNRKTIAVLFTVAALVTFYLYQQDDSPEETFKNLTGRAFSNEEQDQLEDGNLFNTEKITPKDLDLSSPENITKNLSGGIKGFTDKAEDFIKEGKTKGEETSSKVKEEAANRKENLLENFHIRIQERLCEEICATND